MKKISIFLFFIIIITPMFSKPLRVSYIERPPYYYTTNYKPMGFLLDLERKIFNDANIDVVFTPLPAKRALKYIKNSKECSSGWFKTKEREKFAKFTLPIYQNRPFVVITVKKYFDKINKYSSLKDILLDKSIALGIIDGFSYGTYVDKLIKETSPLLYKITGEQHQLIKMLAKNRIAYMLVSPEEIDTLISYSKLSRENFIFITLPDIPNGNKRYIICSKKVSNKTIDKINKSIKKFVSLPSF